MLGVGAEGDDALKVSAMRTVLMVRMFLMGPLRVVSGMAWARERWGHGFSRRARNSGERA